MIKAAPFYSKKFQYYVMIVVLMIMSSCRDEYSGKTYHDSRYAGGAQKIPGRLECEYYDLGGEGVAFHDSDSINSGSGKLNPADGNYLNEFRINEAVDISYTKYRDAMIDNSPYNFVAQEQDKLYVGWTAPGEWVKYTIDVTEAGKFKLGLMYTANQNGKISISLNDMDITGPIDIPSTFAAEDTVAWRQWHHWNYLDNIAEIELKKGVQQITLHTIAIGQMNYEHLDFERIE